MTAVVLLLSCGVTDPVAASSTGLQWRTDADLVQTGFDGLSMPAVGYWIRERLWRAGSDREEVHHHFALTTGPNPCETWWEEPPRPPTIAAGTDPVVACEQRRAHYAARAGRESAPDELVFELSLLDTTGGRGRHAIAPVAGDYAPVGPGDDLVEFTFHGSRVLFDWPAAVADALDCTAPKPWATVPSDDGAVAEFSAQGGTLTLDAPVGEVVPFRLTQLVVVNNGDGGPSPGGVLDGSGVFRACDVDRELRPMVPVDVGM